MHFLLGYNENIVQSPISFIIQALSFALYIER